MWLGEQITEFGIGNGISIILFASIISRIPAGIGTMYSNREVLGRAWYRGHSGGSAGADRSDHARLQRRAPYSRAVCQASGGPQDVRWPEYNAAREGQHVGVLPIIFAQSIAMLPATIAAFLPAPQEGSFWYGFIQAIDTKSVLYMLAYFLMIIGFSYFYATIQFNPTEIANNLKRNGGFIPGFRPGKPTADFIAKVLSRITLFGAIYLGIVAIAPLVASKFISISGLAIGGTSVIIVVGVALETIKALENQMLARQYKGFLE